MKKRIWNKVVSIFTAILLVVGIVPNTTITALAAAEGAPNNWYYVKKMDKLNREFDHLINLVP